MPLHLGDVLREAEPPLRGPMTHRKAPGALSFPSVCLCPHLLLLPSDRLSQNAARESHACQRLCSFTVSLLRPGRCRGLGLTYCWTQP